MSQTPFLNKQIKSGALSVSLEIVSTSDASRTSPNRREVTFEEILGLIGLHTKQWAALALGCCLYAHANNCTLIATMATKSMDEGWNIATDRPMIYNLTFALGNVARLISMIVFLPLMDVIGRRQFTALTFFSSLILLGLAALSPNYWVWLASRVIIMFLSTPLYAASMIYALELLFVNRRALPGCGTQSINVLNIMSMTLIGGALEGRSPENAWRWLAGVMVLSQLIGVGLMIGLWIESPRFLAVNLGKTDEAWKSFAKLTPGGEPALRKLLKLSGTTKPLRHYLKLNGDLAELPEGTRTRPNKLTTLIKASVKSMYSLLTQKETRSKMIVLCLIWFFQSFAHWGLVSYMPQFYEKMHLPSTAITAASFAVQVIAQFILYFLMQSDRVGRLGAIGLFLCCCAVVHGLLAAAIVVYPKTKWLLSSLAVLCNFFGGPVWGPIYTYTAELWPTINRGGGVALPSAAGAIGMILTSYTSTALFKLSSFWIAPALWGGLRLLACLLCFFLHQETNQRPMDERAFGDQTELAPSSQRRKSRIVSSPQQRLISRESSSLLT